MFCGLPPVKTLDGAMFGSMRRKRHYRDVICARLHMAAPLPSIAPWIATGVLRCHKIKPSRLKPQNAVGLANFHMPDDSTTG